MGVLAGDAWGPGGGLVPCAGVCAASLVVAPLPPSVEGLFSKVNRTPPPKAKKMRKTSATGMSQDRLLAREARGRAGVLRGGSGLGVGFKTPCWAWAGTGAGVRGGEGGFGGRAAWAGFGTFISCLQVGQQTMAPAWLSGVWSTVLHLGQVKRSIVRWGGAECSEARPDAGGAAG